VAPSSFNPSSKYEISIAITANDTMKMDLHTKLVCSECTMATDFVNHKFNSTPTLLPVARIDKGISKIENINLTSSTFSSSCNQFGYDYVPLPLRTIPKRRKDICLLAIVLRYNGITVLEKAKIPIVQKENTILIQTDKGIYKPGDRIQFRVLVIDSETRPFKNTKLKETPLMCMGELCLHDRISINYLFEAYIMDPKGNKIKEWQNIQLDNGVFRGDLKLSKEPVIGQWSLHFSCSPQRAPLFEKIVKTKSWKVAEYVPPKFEIITSEPVYNTYKSNKVIFSVAAKYTYGKPVKGTVTVKIDNQQNNMWSGYNVYYNAEQSSGRYSYKIIPINGKAIVEIDLKELKLSSTTYTQTITFEVTVLEEVTGIALQKSITVSIHARDYQIGHVSKAMNFKPGMTYNFYVKVTRPDGKPVIDKDNLVNVIVYYGIGDNKATELAYYLNDQGMAFVCVTIPLSAVLLDFIIKYREADPYTINVPRAVSESNIFIQANILTKP
jgi:CD109 antigen